MKRLLLLALLATTPLFGALPPLAQELRELQALLQSSELTERLTMATQITSISKTADGYLIQTTKEPLAVKVIYLPSAHIGPVSFRLEFEPIKEHPSPQPRISS